MTYGESHTLRKQSIRMERGRFVADKLETCKPRMNKSEATKYYNQRCKDAFNILGVGKVEKIPDFIVNFQMIFKKIRRNTNNMIRRECVKLIKQGF